MRSGAGGGLAADGHPVIGPPLVRLRRLGGALVRRTDVLIELLRRIVPPLVRIRIPPRTPARPPFPLENRTPRGRARGHVRLRARAYVPPKPVSRRIPPPQRRLAHPMSPLAKAAWSRRERRAYPEPVIERPPRELPHPHARIHVMHAQLQVRRRLIAQGRIIHIEAAAAPTTVRVPAPPYYPRFAPIR